MMGEPFTLGSTSLFGAAGAASSDLTVTLSGEGKLGLVLDKKSAAPCKIAKVRPPAARPLPVY